MPAAAELLVEVIDRHIGPVPANGSGLETRGFLSSRSPINMVHEPLQMDKPEIRLLSIHTSSKEKSRLECSLVKTLLQDNLKFTALSYVWGDYQITEEITVNGKQIRVTSNLASALRHIRATGVGEILNSFWVDAICINQQDTLERNHQVQLMGSIYRTAVLVLSWLGPEADHSTLALSLVHRMSKARQNAQLKGDDSLSWFEEFPEIWGNPLGTFADKNSIFYAVECLNFRPLFSRGWIFQESFLAQSQVFMCGHEAVTAQDLYEFGSFFEGLAEGYSKPYFINDVSWLFLASHIWQWGFDSAQAFKKTFRQRDSYPPLSLLLVATHNLKVSEPRDKIYSLLGMTGDIIDIDYERSVDRIFSEVPQIWLWETRTLNFLLWTGYKDTEKMHPGLPSWVPDWCALRQVVLLGYHGDTSPSADVGPYAAISTDTRVLRCSGIPLDVGQISRPILLTDEEVICSTFKNHILKRSQQYPTGIPRLQALFRTFLSNSPGVGHLKEVDMNQYLFCYLGAAFIKKICTVHGQDLLYGSRSLEFSTDTQFGKSFQNRFLGMDSTIRAPAWQSIHEADPNGHYDNVMTLSILHILGHRTFFFSTGNGYLGFSTCDIEPDDTICVLFGCKNLIVLRKLDSSYVVVGPCWILGFMNGEALKVMSDGKADFQVFEIK